MWDKHSKEEYDNRIMGANATNAGPNVTNVGANTTNVGANATNVGANATIMGANATIMGAKKEKKQQKKELFNGNLCQHDLNWKMRIRRISLNSLMIYANLIE